MAETQTTEAAPNAPACHTCGAPATCYGAYDGVPEAFSCDTCCGHGNEDGWCDEIPEDGLCHVAIPDRFGEMGECARPIGHDGDCSEYPDGWSLPTCELMEHTDG